MNDFADRNSLNTNSSNKTMREISIQRKNSKSSNQNLSIFRRVKTSPIVTTFNANDTAKRKKRQNWSKIEDQLLIQLVGGSIPYELKWPQIADRLNKAFDSNRTGKQCRERWLNHLRPDIKKGNWTSDEELMIEYFYNTFGPKWSTMSKLMKNRTDNDIKNKWNSKKRAERAARKKEVALTGNYIREPSKVSKKPRPNQVDAFRWTAVGAISFPHQQTSNKMELLANKNSRSEAI